MSLNRIHHLRGAGSLGVCFTWMALALGAVAQSLSTTTVQGTVYLANGLPGSGTLQISWPAFNTAASQPVAAGKVTASIGADGFVSVNLAPNLGSLPAGLYYTAIYHLSDGTTSTEYWVVPAAAQASIAQVRSQVMPAAQAVQAVSKAYVDQAIQSVAQGNLTSSGGQLTGPLYLSGDPTQALQAADKHYIDASFAQALPVSGGAATGPLTATQLGAAYQVDQFAGTDFGAKLQACLAAVNGTYGGTCDARNFSGNLAMAANLTIATANSTVMLPCATLSTAHQIIVTAGTRNVSLRGCALRGASSASGSQGGTVILYSGPNAAIQVGDNSYAADTLGFHLDNVVVNTTSSSSSSAQALAIFRTQEVDLESLYLLGNANQTGITLDGTGNYTGGTVYDNHISGFQTAVNGIGHQIANSATTDWLNASTFVRLHIDCPTASGNPISGTYGVNLQQGDGNTFTGGDVENCGTALHLGANAQNNTMTGLRNENSTYQVVADAGSSYNSWITGGTMFTGKLTDNGTRNSFLDTFHRTFNSLNGDWYGSQQDATLTNHLRLGIGSGNERGLQDRYQTDYGYRWTMGLSDATGGEQFYQILDELNSVNRISVGQYNNGQASTNNQTVINSAGTGAVVLNGSNNAGTGGVVFGSGGANETTVATIGNSGNAQFNGTLQVGGTAQSAGTMTVRNKADAEVDYYLWPGLTANQKGSFTYKDYNGNSQWYMLKDASNNWALNSATGGLDSFKAYQSSNSGDTYINASNGSGVVRVNYETGSGSAFNIYGGSSSNLYAGFSGAASIKFPGLSASSGHNCLQIDSSGFITNTGAACAAAGGGGTVNNGSAGQIAYYNANGTAVSGMSTVPIGSGGTGATTAANALSALGGVSLASTSAQTLAGPLVASVNSQINVMSYGAKGDCVTNDTPAFIAAQNAAVTLVGGYPGGGGTSLPAVLYLPKPPGGCYIVSAFPWTGVSMEGQPSGPSSSSGPFNVQLKSLAGQDIFHIPDPTYTSGTIYWVHGWSLRNISFVVNDGLHGGVHGFDVAGSGYTNTHRWPGRWFNDANLTSGSNLIGSGHNYGDFSCGDIGQNIVVGGAGSASVATDMLSAAISTATTTPSTITITGGTSSSWPVMFGYLKIDSEILMYNATYANGTTSLYVQRAQMGTTAATHANGATVTVMGNLVTTVASVTPCWDTTGGAWQKVNLTASAGNTVTGAQTYITPANLALNTNIQNCAIAEDLADGQQNNWIGTSQINGEFGIMENVTFTHADTSGYYGACGIFTQGIPALYKQQVTHFGFYGMQWGVVQATSELNSQLQPSSGDYERWIDGSFLFNRYPWLTYNGLSQHLEDIQLSGYAGFQILQEGNIENDPANGWTIHQIGFEAPGVGSTYPGWRVEGAQMNLDGVSMTGDGIHGQTAQMNANSSKCICGGGITVNGFQVALSGEQATLSDNGVGNTSWWSYNANPPNGIQSNYPIANLPYKGSNNMSGRFTPDFITDGNTGTPYNHDDFFIWPKDVEFAPAYGWASTVVPDTTSPTGYYLKMVPTFSFSQINQFTAAGVTGSSLVVGKNIPIGQTTLYMMAKCPAGTTSFTPYMNSATYNNAMFSCTTSYQIYALHATFNGGDSNINIGEQGSNTVYVAWFYVQPNVKVNGLPTIGTGAAIPTGPAATTAGDCVKFADGVTTLADAGYPCAVTYSDATVINALNWTWNAGATTTADATSPIGYSTSVSANGVYPNSVKGDYNINGGHLFQAVPSRLSVTVGGGAAMFTDALSGAITSGSSSATLSTATTSSWESSGYLRIDQEIIYYTQSTGSTTITLAGRGIDGTTPMAHASGAAIYGVGRGNVQAYCNGAVQTNLNVWFDPVFTTFSAPFPAQNCAGYATQFQLQNIYGPAGYIPKFVQMQITPDSYAALAGTTGSIGGSTLTAGSCAAGSVSIPGATTSMAVAVSPAGGTSPGAGFVWQGFVSTAGTVAVQVCALSAGTPAATGYNVRVIP